MTFDILTILEKLQSPDADLRYMAATDLLKELKQKGAELRLDQDLERRLVSLVLKKLEDSNGEVQGLAVKIFGPLAKSVRESQLEEMVQNLSSTFLTRNPEHEELRDVAGMSLKGVVADLPSGSPANNVVKSLLPNLLTGMRGDDLDVQLESLEILDGVLRRFGSFLGRDYGKIQESVFLLLTSPRGAIRKRAITCVSRMAQFVSEAQFEEVIMGILEKAKSGSISSASSAYVQAFTGISRSIGYRMGAYLNDVVKLIKSYTTSEIDDELREVCLHAYESFVLRCPKEIAPFLNDGEINIIGECLEYIHYDPNYALSDDEAMDIDSASDDGMDNEVDESDDEYDGDYSDDDDLSWKVRRASAKCLGAVIVSRPELLVTLHEKVAPILIQRFREREDSVKGDIFTAYTQLIKATGVVCKGEDHRDHPAGAALSAAIPSLIKASAKQLKEKSTITRLNCFQMLNTLLTVLPNTLNLGTNEHLAPLVPGIVSSLSDKVTDTKLKICVLSFLCTLLDTFEPVACQPHLSVLAEPIVKTINDPYYKITAESLNVFSGLIKALRPMNDISEPTPAALDLVNKAYVIAMSRLSALDIDQEVKDAVITCTGLIVAHFGDVLGDKLSNCLPILLDRLRNEITRLTAVKAFSLIAQSPRVVNMASVLNDVVNELATFLRKANRHLRQSSLTALEALIQSQGSTLTEAQVQLIVTELAPLISDIDLHMSHLAISLTVVLLKSSGAASVSFVVKSVLPRALVLIQSPLLQGVALESLLQLFVALVSDAKGPGFDKLLNQLMAAVKPNADAATLNRQSLVGAAQAVSVLCINAVAKKCENTVLELIGNVTSDKISEGGKLLALFSLGYIGRSQDLSSHTSLVSSIMNAFSTPSEEVKSAASFALGNIAVGCMEKYVPLVLKEIETQPARQYLLLHSLKEIITQTEIHSRVDALEPFKIQILDLLYLHCESKEEGTRNVVAECLGKIILLEPDVLLRKLLELSKYDRMHTRSTAVTAVKFCVAGNHPELDEILKGYIAEFLLLIKDNDFNVRRAALLTMNFIAHNKPGLLIDLLPGILDDLYNETIVKEELIRKIDLGPFSHQVDDGLDLRKAAFSCMYSLLEKTPDKLELSTFLSFLVYGLKDDYDIRLLSHSILTHLCHVGPTVVVSGLDSLIDPLRSTVTTKVKATAVKQEEERNDDLIRSALRVIRAISLIQDSHSSTKFADLLVLIKSGPHSAKYEALGSEGDVEEF